MSGCKRGMAASLHESVSPLMNLCGAFPSPCPTVLSVTMALHQPWSLVFDNSHFHEGDVILIVPVCILPKVIDSDLFPCIYWTRVYWLESLSILRLSFILSWQFHTCIQCALIISTLLPTSRVQRVLPAGVFTDFISSILWGGDQWLLWVHEYSGHTMAWRRHFPAFLCIPRSYIPLPPLLRCSLSLGIGLLI